MHLKNSNTCIAYIGFMNFVLIYFHKSQPELQTFKEIKTMYKDNGKDKCKILVRLGAIEGLDIKCPGENIYDLKYYPSSSVFSKVGPKPRFQTFLA